MRDCSLPGFRLIQSYEVKSVDDAVGFPGLHSILEECRQCLGKFEAARSLLCRLQNRKAEHTFGKPIDVLHQWQARKENILCRGRPIVAAYVK